MSPAWLSNTPHKNPRYIGGGVVFLLFFAFLLTYQFGGTSKADNALSGSLTRRNVLEDIANATLGFQRILAINLPERTDHHDGLVLASDVSRLEIDFIDGVRGDTILEKVLPAHFSTEMSPAQRGAWRAHINSISRVVESGLTTALIIEDDVDWDIRLKRQLQDFAVASRYILSDKVKPGFTDLKDAAESLGTAHSPYGDGWDVLWFGHCGMDLADANNAAVLHHDDETVAPIKDQKSWDPNASSPLKDLPEHTRVVSAVSQGTCSLAYAVSRNAAKKMLFNLGLRRLNMPFDLMLRDWCQGETGLPGYIPKCFTVLPQLFDHHRRVGPQDIDSDISDKVHGSVGGYRDTLYTLNIRQSVRMNMENLLMGITSFNDQWPD